jgi:hypothetical protein
MQVRAFKRVELVIGKVQRRPEFVGRRERVEVRRVNEGVVTVGERKRYMLAFFFLADAISRGKTGRKKKEKKEGKVTSHLLICYPMEADVNDDHLAFGPTLEYGRIFEYGLQRALG